MDRQLVNLKSNAVCEQVIKVAKSLIDATEIPLNHLLHFISTIPRELTDYFGTQLGEIEYFSFGGISFASHFYCISLQAL